MTLMQDTQDKPIIEVTKEAFPICCPPKDQAHWNQHPRVYLNFGDEKQVDCPYCGNRFKLID